MKCAMEGKTGKKAINLKTLYAYRREKALKATAVCAFSRK